MISSLAKALAKTGVGPDPSYGFGPGAKAGVDPKEGGPGSGPSAGGESDHRGARIYKSGNAVRALTPSGHNIGPFKNEALLKSHLDKNDTGFGLNGKTKKEKKEATSSTSSVAQLRPAKKETAVSGVPSHADAGCIFKESSSPTFKNHKFEVELIKEGLGNFRDCFFYTRESLQAAADSKLFEGVQCFADHPSEIEEQSRPERSTRDILGYYENIRFQEKEGQGVLTADLLVSDAISLDWAMSLFSNSIEYSKKFQESDLVGLSINANGSAKAVPIDEFMKGNELADPVLKKLQEAAAQGVTEINVVNELREAQSVDLVTKAGAGGRILQMLEQERKMKRKNFRETESHETEDGQAAAGDGVTADHADADQDKKLFAQMIKQYLGKEDPSQEEMEMAQHAHEAAKEMGMEGKEAYETAGSHMKMAMAIGKKMAQKQSKESSEHDESEETESHEAEEGDCDDEDKKKEGQTPPPNPKEGKKEAMKVAALSGEVAKLRESVRKYELRDYLEKKLSESGKSNVVTKKFRETLGLPKSKDQIDSTWKVFISAYEAGVEEVGSSDDGFFGEKTTYRESSVSSKKNSLADCLR